MKTTILSLVLASIAGFMHCSNESLAVTQEPEDKELRALLEARRDTLKQLVTLSQARINSEAGRDPSLLLHLSEYQQELQLAELDVAQSKAERIGIIEKTLIGQKALEIQLKVTVPHNHYRQPLHSVSV
jgi:hypothetical protein